ncbi:substrate-binding domain-containing protein [Dinoroseobacter sp. S124A]|uniref:substrate-binding domain-containing protein n=1 Tax=Dinoroseobacter sp. S124A TaxID=3415128 RepID=UPI003C7D7050
MPQPEIEFIVPVALREVMDVLGPVFEAETGHRLRITHMLNPEVPGHVATGAAWDIAITNPVYVAQIIAAGHSPAGRHRPFGRAPLSFAARGPASAPAVTDPARIAAVILGAGRIGLTDQGTSGAQFHALARSLGVTEQVADRLCGLEGGGPMRALKAGEVDLAVLPLTNIAPVPGVHAVAICPEALEVHVDLSLCLSHEASEAAQGLAAWLTDPARDGALAALGARRFGP